MTLSQYIQKHCINCAAFARKLGVQRMTLYSWRTGRNVPRTKYMKKIAKLTNDAVRFEDFAP